MLKIKLTIVALLIAVMSSAQIFKSFTGNWHAKGFWKYDKPISVETKSVTGQKVVKWDSTYQEVILNDIDLEPVIVAKKDSTNITTGSYVTRYDFRNEPSRENTIKIWRNYGSTIKLFPASALIFTSTMGMVDGTVFWSLCYTADTITLTGFRYALQTAGAFTGDAFNGIALCSVSGGVATQIATTANNEAIWKTASFTPATVNLTAPITIPPGYYVTAAIYNSSAQTTAPVIQGHSVGSCLSVTAGLGVSLGLKTTAQATVPTPYTLSGAGDNPYMLGIFGF